jgi:hypothetical protein
MHTLFKGLASCPVLRCFAVADCKVNMSLPEDISHPPLQLTSSMSLHPMPCMHGDRYSEVGNQMASSLKGFREVHELMLFDTGIDVEQLLLRITTLQHLTFASGSNATTAMESLRLHSCIRNWLSIHPSGSG